MASPSDLYERAACELLRALRAGRSQIAFARRLGYRANPITDWEHGRRFPTAEETLRAARLVGRDPGPALSALAPPEGREWTHVPQWLTALRGSGSTSDLARRAEASRYAVTRWLSGQTRVRLPDFLRLVDAATGRLHEWLDLLVGIDSVPSFVPRFEQADAARRLALSHPWTEAVLRVIETRDYQQCRLGRSARGAEYIARRLDLDIPFVCELLDVLEKSHIVILEQRRYRVIAQLTVDTGGNEELLNRVRRHWAGVALRRLDRHRRPDWFAYNLMSVSEADAQKIEERLRAAYREVRGIVGQSQPTERAALLTIHLVRW